MRLRNSLILLLFFLAALIILSGCNATNTAANQPPSTPPPTNNPPPTSPPPGNPPPTSQGFAVSLGSAANSADAGQLTISSAGASVLDVKGVTASAPFMLEFCPYPTGDQPDCPGVTTFTADASGTAHVTFQYPNKGTFMGAFTVVNTSSGQIEAMSMWEQAVPSAHYQAGIFQAGSVSGGIGKDVGSDPLTSGLVTTNKTTVHIELRGAKPSTTYSIGVEGNGDGSSSFGFNTITTDASGNATQDFPMTGDGPIDNFLFGRAAANGVQFVSGFKVQ